MLAMLYLKHLIWLLKTWIHQLQLCSLCFWSDIVMCWDPQDGLLVEARLPATYQRALLVLTDEVDVPDEVEENQALEENQFHIEKILDDCSDKASLDAEEDDEEAEEEEPSHEEKVQEPPKRQRKENTMVGGVRKGKYGK